MPEIFQAKSIVTMNLGQPRATHVLVSQGHIMSVGTADDVAEWQAKYPDARVNTQFAEKVILPGFVEGHSQHHL